MFICVVSEYCWSSCFFISSFVRSIFWLYFDFGFNFTVSPLCCVVESKRPRFYKSSNQPVRAYNAKVRHRNWLTFFLTWNNNIKDNHLYVRYKTERGETKKLLPASVTVEPVNHMVLSLLNVTWPSLNGFFFQTELCSADLIISFHKKSLVFTKSRSWISLEINDECLKN